MKCSKCPTWGIDTLDILDDVYNKGETYFEQERFPEIVCVEQ